MKRDKKSFAQSLGLALFFLIASVTFSSANVPAPPVNQKIGIPDTTFANLTKLNCAYCHAPEKLTAEEIAQMGWTFDRPEMKPGIIADRHHARVINGLIMGDKTQAPFGTPGEPYVCLSCHKIEWNEATMRNELIPNFKDCQNCHFQVDGATVHHLTSMAQELNCKHCHGARINNPNEGHYVPLGRTPTLFTPRTSAGQGPGGQGACTYCHNAGVDTASGIAVNENSVNHHNTGIGQPGISDISCDLCHDRMGSEWAIRRCETCHGISSIHNIQADSNGDGQIIVGQELRYFGHVGNDPNDCKGCHNNLEVGQNNLGAPESGPIIPQISGMSEFKIVAGEDFSLTVSGLAFTNQVSGRLLKSTITVANLDNVVVAELTPSSISQSTIVVTIPSSLEAGSYYIRAKKGPKDSNPMSLVVIPKVVISSVTTNNSALTISGSGFGKHLNAAEANTHVTMAGTKCNIDSWTSSQIVAQCSSGCGSLVVNSIFGSATYTIDCEGGGDNDNDYQRGYDAAYDAAYTEGNGDRCSGKAWNIDAALSYDTKYNQGYTDGYVYAYDVGWESSCGNGGNDGSSYEDGYKAAYDAAFAEGNGDKCSGKVWNIDANLNYDTKYNQGYTDGYVVAYDEGWESSCGNGGNDGSSYEDGVNAAQEAGFAEGKSDSCGGKTWNIGVELTYDTPYNDGYAFGYIKAYDEGWESCR